MFFFFNDTATTEIYTLSLHDALPISQFLDGVEAPHPKHILLEGADEALGAAVALGGAHEGGRALDAEEGDLTDRKSTRLNSSHANISYAVFCLKKKKNTTDPSQI